MLDLDIMAVDIENIIKACNQHDDSQVSHAPGNPNDTIIASKLKQLVPYGSEVDDASINNVLACLCATNPNFCYLEKVLPSTHIYKDGKL